MRITNLEELRKVHQEINSIVKNGNVDFVKSNEQMILNATKKMLELCRIARREGLLALEEEVADISIDSEYEILKQLIILIVDGTDAEVLKGIGMARYYGSLYTDYMALRYLIYIEGALSIQAGDNPRIVEEKLKVMLPHNMYAMYSAKQQEEELEIESKKSENLIEKLCKCERLWNIDENGYYVSRLLDYVLCDMPNKDVQRLMREVDNVVLSFAMKGISGNARKRIFDNLSERLGKYIAENMVHMAPVRAIDIVDAMQKMLNKLIKLVDAGELYGNYGYLEPFYNVINIDTKQIKSKNSKIGELKEILNDYEKGSEFVNEKY